MENQKVRNCGLSKYSLVDEAVKSNGTRRRITIFKALTGGPRIFALAGMLAVTSAGIGFAADTPQATIAYRPGDTVRVFVTFAQPVALKGAWLRFGLQGQLPDGQKVFAGLFDANTPVKLSEREYEFDARISDHVAGGIYELSFITATDQADLTRGYTARTDFPVITISVRNDRRFEFPNIQSIRLGDRDKEADKP